MKFETELETWNSYRLADGTELRSRTILVSVKRRDNEWGPNGNPIYDFNFQQIMHVNAPDHLKSEPGGFVRKMDA
jgi:hypothetical protein